MNDQERATLFAELESIIETAIDDEKLRSKIHSDPEQVADDFKLSEDASTILQALTTDEWDKAIKEFGYNGELIEEDLQAIIGGRRSSLGSNFSMSKVLIGRAMKTAGGRISDGLATACGEHGCCAWESAVG